jgi:hypothetical protein
VPEHNTLRLVTIAGNFGDGCFPVSHGMLNFWTSIDTRSSTNKRSASHVLAVGTSIHNQQSRCSYQEEYEFPNGERQ